MILSMGSSCHSVLYELCLKFFLTLWYFAVYFVGFAFSEPMSD